MPPINSNLFTQLQDWAATRNTTAEEVIKSAVDGFYTRALRDSRLFRFFEDADLDALKKHQLTFMEKLFGDEEGGGYTSGQLFRIHQNLIRNRGLRPIHFDYFMESFMDSFREQQVDSELMVRIQERLVPFRQLFTQATTQYTMGREERLFFSLDDDADGTILAEDLKGALHSAGLLPDDDRLSEVYQQLDAVGDCPINLDRFSQIIGTSGLLVENALQGGLSIPDFEDFSRRLDVFLGRSKTIVEEFRHSIFHLSQRRIPSSSVSQW